MGENEDVITLLDEEGVEHEFSIVDVLEVSDQRYAILQPLETGEEPDTAVIFRMEGDSLVTIEDDAEFERVRAAFEAESEADGAGETEPGAVNGAGDRPSGDHDSNQSH